METAIEVELNGAVLCHGGNELVATGCEKDTGKSDSLHVVKAVYVCEEAIVGDGSRAFFNLGEVSMVVRLIEVL